MDLKCVLVEPDPRNNHLFQLAGQGVEGAQDLVLRAASWKNYVLGEGASEDIYTGTISTKGEPDCV